MSNEKVSDFEILSRMADENTSDGIAMFPTVLKANLTQKGGQITFGVPGNALQWALKDTHYFVVYAIKKEDYSRVKAELESPE